LPSICEGRHRKGGRQGGREGGREGGGTIAMTWRKGSKDDRAEDKGRRRKEEEKRGKGRRNRG
jgi:hypothetical protein